MLIEWLSGRPLRFLALFVGAALALAANSPAASPQEAPRSQIVGIWRGNSVCAVANSPCHDEVNVYRFSDIPAKPGHFSCAASKIVNGKEIIMGTGEWTYDPAKHILETASSAPSIHLTLDGDRLDGALTLPDNTIYRRIHLKKAP